MNGGGCSIAADVADSWNYCRILVIQSKPVLREEWIPLPKECVCHMFVCAVSPTTYAIPIYFNWKMDITERIAPIRQPYHNVLVFHGV